LFSIDIVLFVIFVSGKLSHLCTINIA